MVNPSLALHYVREKVRRWPEFATFRTKAVNFTRVIHSNWLAKIKLRGPAPLVVNIINTYRHVYCLYAKMLKETETEKTIGFFVIILSLEAFQLGGGRPPGYACGTGSKYFCSSVATVMVADPFFKWR